MIVAPQHMTETLARVARAAFEAAGQDVPDSSLGRFIAERSPEPAAEKIARRLIDADNGFLVVGDQALFHPEASRLRALAFEIARTTETALMVLPGPANSEGAWRAGMVPGAGGMSAVEQLAQGRKAYLLFDLEPEFDVADPQAARRSLAEAEAVVAIAAFAGNDLLEAADVILPLGAGAGSRRQLRQRRRLPPVAQTRRKTGRRCARRLEDSPTVRRAPENRRVSISPGSPRWIRCSIKAMPLCLRRSRSTTSRPRAKPACGAAGRCPCTAWMLWCVDRRRCRRPTTRRTISSHSIRLRPIPGFRRRRSSHRAPERTRSARAGAA